MGPPCPSFYGHFHLLSRQNLTAVLADLHNKYGSVVKLWLGPTQLLVSIKDQTLVKEMLLKAADMLPMTGRAFQLAFGRSTLFASSFDQVQKRRETLFTELNGKHHENKNVIPTKAVDSILMRINNMGKNSVDSKVVSQNMAFTILGATLFGDAFLAWSKADAYEELLMMIAKEAGLWTSYYVTPFWKRGFWKYQSVCRKLKCLTQDIVQQCCNLCFWETGNLGKKVACGGPSCSEVGIKNNIFFEELNGYFIISEEPYGNLMGIMFHGSLSTASLINNIFMNLAMHQQIQDKELMIFLVCPLKDFTLKNGQTIPAGAGLVVPVELVMMDESTLGGAASEFNPYRFLSKAGNGSDIYQRKSFAGAAQNFVYQGESSFNLNDPDKSTAFLPFGSGVRACVGQKFVTEGVATLFASLLRQYEIKLYPEAQDTSKPSNFGFQPLSSLHIVFVERDC